MNAHHGILIALAIAAAGCKATSGATPMDTATPEPGAMQKRSTGSLPDLERELSQYEAQLQGAGVRFDERQQEALAGQTADDDGEAAPARDEAEPRCDRVCDLADATCDLATRICDLADDHPNEDRYTQACTRARNTCERATEACRDCA
jgi:hypothetical protein